MTSTRRSFSPGVTTVMRESLSPGFTELTTSITSSEEETGSPSTSVITSPMGTRMPSICFHSPPRMPAFSAGPSGVTSLTIAPLSGRPYSFIERSSESPV